MSPECRSGEQEVEEGDQGGADAGRDQSVIGAEIFHIERRVPGVVRYEEEFRPLRRKRM
jgi:hypothetical protein